jgi:3-deoxy-D-manno-octulosonic-acid transferase
MYSAYSLLLTLGLVVLFPYFLLQALLHGKYVAGIRQRLGSIPPLANRDRPVIWIHCVSVGETQAARPLIEQLKHAYPDHFLVVSTITDTGQKLAQDLFRNVVHGVFYFPIDWRWTVRRALKIINPSAVLIMETELWPNFLSECSIRRIPVAVVNGRISPGSFQRYSWIKSFVARVLSCLAVGVMQSEVDAERIKALGLAPARLRIAGNLKFDSSSRPAGLTNEEVKRRFGFNSEVPVLLAASTHHPEERLILESFQKLRETIPLRLIMAPRHPERFQEVATLLKNSGLSWARRTDAPKSSDTEAQVLLLDTIGELTATYPLASIVFVGGSLIKHGGQNVLEPAAAGVCVVTGNYTSNFHAIVQLLNEADALVQLPPLEGDELVVELTTVFTDLLINEGRRQELGKRAQRIVIENHGATERTLGFIKPLLGARDPSFQG